MERHMRSNKLNMDRMKDLLALHRSERRGNLLLLMLVLIFAARATYVQWFAPPPDRDMQLMEQGLKEWLALRDSLDRAKTHATITAVQEPFDPNALDQQGWMAWGLSERQAASVLRFKDSRGGFRSKEEVARVYAIPPAVLERMEPYIALPEQSPQRERKAGHGKPMPYRTARTAVDTGRIEQRPPWPERMTEPRRPVEINTADSTELVRLRGIGPSFARAIIRYRSALGGFLSLDQLAEVYILSDKPDAVERIRTQLVLDTLMVERIAINTCSEEELAHHPYASWKMAKALLAYRANHGPFRTVADIRGCHLIDEDTFRKLAPYLSVE